MTSITNLQFEAAEKAWSEYDVGDAKVIESNRFETDGPDRLICKFFYEDDENPDGDSLVASFCVNFVTDTDTDTDTIKEAYINWN